MTGRQLTTAELNQLLRSLEEVLRVAERLRRQIARKLQRRVR
jgi:hypothetical protein